VIGAHFLILQLYETVFMGVALADGFKLALVHKAILADVLIGVEVVEFQQGKQEGYLILAVLVEWVLREQALLREAAADAVLH
jgi:hypothetical protein